MGDRSVKQVIVMRHKFTDSEGNIFSPRKGKYIAQGAHAANAFLIHRIENLIQVECSEDFRNGDIRLMECPEGTPHHKNYLQLTSAMIEWMTGSFTKVCVRVDSESDLMDIYQKAQKAGLEVHLITDSGRTEFKEPTVTCLAIGPDYAENIDPITGHLKLL